MDENGSVNMYLLVCVKISDDEIYVPVDNLEK